MLRNTEARQSRVRKKMLLGTPTVIGDDARRPAALFPFLLTSYISHRQRGPGCTIRRARGSRSRVTPTWTSDLEIRFQAVSEPRMDIAQNLGKCPGMWAITWAIAQYCPILPSIAQILGNSNGCCPALSETKPPDFEVCLAKAKTIPAQCSKCF